MAAAEVALAGMDPLQFMSIDREERRSLIHAIAKGVSEIRQAEREDLAVLIANKVGQAFGG